MRHAAHQRTAERFAVFFNEKINGKEKSGHIKTKGKERRAMRKRKIIAVLAIGAIMAGMLTACASNESSLSGSRTTLSGIPIVGKSTDIQKCVTIAPYDIPDTITYKEGTKEEALNEARTEIWDQIKNNATFNGIPADMYEEFEKEYEENCLYISGSESLSQYLDYAGITKEDHEKAKAQYAEANCEQELVLLVVADSLGINEESPEYEEAYTAFIDSTGLTEKEAEGELIKRTVLYKSVLGKLTEGCTVTKEVS